MSLPLTLFEIRNARDSEETPAAMEAIFAALGTGAHAQGLFEKLQSLFKKHTEHPFYSFEIISVNSEIHFFVACPSIAASFVESQLTAQYPKIVVQKCGDYMPHFLALPHVSSQLSLASPYYFPLKTFKDTRDLDVLAGLLGQLAKLPKNEAIAIQIVCEPASSSWQHNAQAVIEKGVPDLHAKEPRTKTHPKARLIESKAVQTGFFTAIRLTAVSENIVRAETLGKEVSATFGIFTLGDSNALVFSQPAFWQKKQFAESLLLRSPTPRPSFQILGASELATLWHPPGLSLAAIRNISWGKKLTGEAPINLPVYLAGEEEKKTINFFARAEYKNVITTFGIKKEDRRKHMYIIGKTGTGKSTMIANMAINDMRNGEGVAVIDPHGDLTNTLLDYVPSYRVNDVCLLDPSDLEYAFHLNPLEVHVDADRELIASGIVSIFQKLYAHSWGPRLEYILRNSLLTLLSVPQTTLLDIPQILTNDSYRAKVTDRLEDTVLKNYWLNEFNRMTPQLKSEAISPILNKVGQFLSARTIRNVVGHPASTVHLEKMMNEGKIVLVNLSQGKLGEDNSSLLGAMMITKMQLAAMNRVYVSEEKRRDFYLYVDEFQNFATSSFIKILSEARKYRLNLILANQYIGQIDEDVQKAIFGNAGSLVSFGVGAEDARLLSREFGMLYKEDELVGLGNHDTVVKLSIDNQTSLPFSATTLPLPHATNQNREKIIRSSRERFTRKIE